MITTFINSKKIPHPVSSVIMFGRMVLESLISASTVTQIPGWERSHADTIAWSYDMEGHAKKCVERYCELANKNIQQSCKVSTPCMDDHKIKDENRHGKPQLASVHAAVVCALFVNQKFVRTAVGCIFPKS